VQFTASTDVVLFTVASTAGYSVGDSVTISSLPATNGINSYNGTWTIATVPTATTFTITDTAGATDIVDTATSGNGTAYNITNSRFDGEQVVSGVPDAKSIYFSTLYREKYALRNVSGSNVQSFTCVVFKDADYLEIDTKDQEVSLNGNSGLYRGYIDTLSDWVRLDSNNNKILLDDAQQVPLYVEKRTRVAATGSSTLSFPEPHTYSIGDNILVRDIGSTYDTAGRAVITSYSRAGNVVTATANAHGFSASDVVVVGGIDYAIDGRYSVGATVTTDTFQFVTNSSGTVYSTEVQATAKKTIRVLTFGRSSNTVTLTTSTAHGLTAGSAIYVAGVHSEFDGQWYVATAADTTTLTYSTEIKYNENYPTTNAPTDANVYRRFPVLSFTDYSVTYNSGNTSGTNETNVEFGLLASVDNQRFTSISKVARQSSIATVTTTTRHGYEVGEPLTINGNTESSFYVGTGNEVKVSTWTLATNTVTVTTSSTHGLLANDKATIYGIRTGAFFDLNGQYTVATIPTSTSFTYTVSGPIKLSYNVTSYSVVDNIVRLQLDAKPEFDLTYDSLNNDYPISTQINVQSGLTGFPEALKGVHDIVGSDTETNVVWYTTTAGNVAPTALTSTTNTMNVVYTVTPERGRVQRVVEAVYYTINNSTGATEDLGPLMTNPVAGTRGWVRTKTDHGFIAGDTVLISGLSPLFDGTQKIAGIVGTTVFYFTVDVTTLVAHQDATLKRNGTNVGLTFTSPHGFVPGDKIWVYAPNSTYIPGGSGVQTVLTTPANNTLQFTVSTSQTQSTAQGGYKVLPYQEDADATIVYPVLDDPAPTDFTFSYKNANVTNVTGNTIANANTAGEVVFSSDARMNVFYRSAWIG
jgi:hypothetical protein